MQDISLNYDKCYDIYLIGIDGNKNIKQEQYFCLEVPFSRLLYNHPMHN